MMYGMQRSDRRAVVRRGPPPPDAGTNGVIPRDARLRPPVAWAGDGIDIIDQTRLPATCQIVHLATVEATIDAIRRLAVRGAPAIGACGGLAMVLGLDEARPSTRAEAVGALDGLVDRIGSARPTAVNLSWAVRRVRDAAAAEPTPAAIRERALHEAQRIIDEDREACRLIGEFGRAALGGATTILTHCNAGRLATLGWGTALGVVYARAAAGEPVRVFACEARPLLQGARLTAWELMDAGIDVTLIADGAAAPLLHSGRVDAVVVGADRIAANGDTANKIGTFGIALAARHAGVPFYVAAPTSTFDPATPTGDAIVVEERSPDEVTAWQGHATAPAGVRAWNPAFDVTPHDLITAFFTEGGVLQPPFDGLSRTGARGR
jgi:methylthioribose-1-phosphate isomerase